jgi:hypothetical protein
MRMNTTVQPALLCCAVLLSASMLERRPTRTALGARGAVEVVLAAFPVHHSNPGGAPDRERFSGLGCFKGCRWFSVSFWLISTTDLEVMPQRMIETLASAGLLWSVESSASASIPYLCCSGCDFFASSASALEKGVSRCFLPPFLPSFLEGFL